jgi:hypothetical protein
VPALTKVLVSVIAFPILLSAREFGTGGTIQLPVPPPLPAEMRNQAPLQPPPNLPDPTDLMEQLRQLQELIAMSPEKLSKLRQSIEFIERMSPAEREAMRIRLAQVTELNQELQVEVDRLHSFVPDLRKSNLAQFWIASSEDEREATRREVALLEKPEDKAGLLKDKVAAFVQKREATLDRMRSRAMRSASVTEKN